MSDNDNQDWIVGSSSIKDKKTRWHRPWRDKQGKMTGKNAGFASNEEAEKFKKTHGLGGALRNAFSADKRVLRTGTPQVLKPPKSPGFFARMRDKRIAGMVDKERGMQNRIQELEYTQLKRQVASETALVQGTAIYKGFKKIAYLVIGLLLIAIVGFLVIGPALTNHRGVFSYQDQAFYSPFINGISSFLSPLFSGFSGDIGCVVQAFSGTACIGYSTSATVQNVYPTFNSFLTLTPAPGTVNSIFGSYQALFLTSKSGSPGQLFYSVQNTANVPLGTDTNNPILLNESCGNPSDPAAGTNCMATTVFTPNIPPNSKFVSIILPQQTIENHTNLEASCPGALPGEVLPSSGTVTVPSVGIIGANFTVKNYSAATTYPIEFLDSGFAQQLESASQAVQPNQKSVNFVTPGPLQITISASEPLPITTNTGSIPLSIAIDNYGTGSYVINMLSVFIPKSLWPNPITIGSYTCSSSNGGRRLNFILPNSSYWNCTLVTPIQQNQFSGSSGAFVLPQVTSLPPAQHFDTVPIITYLNYNYIQSMSSFTYVVLNESLSC